MVRFTPHVLTAHAPQMPNSYTLQSRPSFPEITPHESDPISIPPAAPRPCSAIHHNVHVHTHTHTHTIPHVRTIVPAPSRRYCPPKGLDTSPSTPTQCPHTHPCGGGRACLTQRLRPSQEPHQTSLTVCLSCVDQCSTRQRDSHTLIVESCSMPGVTLAMNCEPSLAFIRRAPPASFWTLP
jgi:hypothetical protein